MSLEAKMRERDKRIDEVREALADDFQLQDTDLANARRLLQKHGKNMRWTAARGWLVFDGQWMHVGTPEALAEAERRLLEQSVQSP